MSNVFSCVGTVGRDAEVRYLPSGMAVLNVSVANNIGFGDKQQTIWLRVAVWGKKAEGNLKTFLLKGQQVFVSGELTMSEYRANDGTMKTSLELNANVIELVGKKSDSSAPSNYAQPATQQPTSYGNNQQAPSYAPPSQASNTGNDNFDAPYDDDIPF